MNGTKKKILLVACLAIAAILVCAALTACDDNDDNDDNLQNGFLNGGNYGQYNQNAYTVGGGEIAVAGINKLEINWIAGSVEFAVGEGANLSFREETDVTDDNYKMRYRVFGTTLRIEFMQAGSPIKSDLQKKLIVTAPATKFVEVECDAASSDIKMAGWAANNIELETYSGNISVSNVSANELSADALSGNIEIKNSVFTELDTDSVSGTTDIIGNAVSRETSAESTSGIINIDGKNHAGELDVETVSGTVNVTFADTNGFSLLFQSRSGVLSSDFTTVPGTFGRVTYGNGALVMEVETTSGNLNIKRG